MQQLFQLQESHLRHLRLHLWRLELPLCAGRRAGQGVCVTGSVTNGDCSASSDCPSGNVCVINTCLGGVCVPANDSACPNPGGQAGARRRFRRAAAYKSEWNPLFGRYMDM
jgi:hypothetical protein